MSQIKNSNKDKDNLHHWVSLEEFSNQEVDTEKVDQEFPTKQFEKSDKSINRRDFLKFSAASLSLAGVYGCDYVRRPKNEILPYSDMPEDIIPGRPLYYATTFALGEESTGLLVETHEGRPTKIEGNPLYPGSLGATDIFAQASLLDLYNPDRLKQVHHNGKASEWKLFLDYIHQKLPNKKVAFLTKYSQSPSFYSLANAIQSKYSGSKFYRYDAFNNDNIYQGIKAVVGKEAMPVVDYKKADLILSFDSDFLGSDSHSLANTKDFSSRRDVEKGKLNRLYQLESTYSITGAAADHRFQLKREEIKIFCLFVLYELYRFGIQRIDSIFYKDLKKIYNLYKSKFQDKLAFKNLSFIVSDLIKHGDKTVLVAGSHQPVEVHAIAAFINQRLKSTCVQYVKSPFKDEMLSKTSRESISGLAEDIKKGEVDVLITLDSNPLHDAPSDLEFEKLFEKIDVVSFGSLPNDTTAKANWVLPKSHYLESWSDCLSSRGVSSIVQPVIMPLYQESKSEIDFLSLLMDSDSILNSSSVTTDLQYVKSNSKLTDTQWKKSLHNGIIKKGLQKKINFDSNYVYRFWKKNVNLFFNLNLDDLELVFKYDGMIYDGRFANNSWLQELPHPITRLTWDNAVIISYDLAQKNSLKNYDLVELSYQENGKTFKTKGSVWVLPGQEEKVISVSLGYGQKSAGKVSDGTGFAFEKLRTSSSFDAVNNIKLKKLSGEYILASVQDHWRITDKIFEGKASSNSQNDRPIHRSATEQEYRDNPEIIKEMEEVPHLDKNHDRKKNDTRDRHDIYGDGMSVFNGKKIRRRLPMGIDYRPQ